MIVFVDLLNFVALVLVAVLVLEGLVLPVLLDEPTIFSFRKWRRRRSLMRLRRLLGDDQKPTEQETRPHERHAGRDGSHRRQVCARSRAGSDASPGEVTVNASEGRVRHGWKFVVGQPL